MSNIFFYKESADFGYLSNFHLKTFTAPDPAQWLPLKDTSRPLVYSDPSQLLTFRFSEQYFMYCKALQFGDPDIADKILAAKLPAKCKSLGRKVSNFDEKEWDRCRVYIMEEALWWKFGGGQIELDPSAELSDLGCRLLKTGDGKLLEAARRDRVWGIGYSVSQQPEKYEHKWGQNLLGLTLERVRSRLQEQEQQSQSDDVGS